MKEETAEEKQNPNDIANKILNEYLEGKSYRFIKSVLNFIDIQLDTICTLPIVSEMKK